MEIFRARETLGKNLRKK